MPTYIEYELDDHAIVLIEAAEELGGIAKVARGEPDIRKSKKKFTEALKDIKVQSQLLLKEIEKLNVAEAEIKFGITTAGEVGNMVIGKIGMGVNYEITLRWQKSARRKQSKTNAKL